MNVFVLTGWARQTQKEDRISFWAERTSRRSTVSSAVRGMPTEMVSVHLDLEIHLSVFNSHANSKTLLHRTWSAQCELTFVKDYFLSCISEYFVYYAFTQWKSEIAAGGSELSSVPTVIVTLEPCEGSETYVNGKRVNSAVQLRSGEPLTIACSPAQCSS